MFQEKNHGFLNNTLKTKRKVFRVVIIIPLIIVTLTIVVSIQSWFHNANHINTILEKAFVENHIKMESTVEHIEEYLGGVHSDLLYISFDKHVKRMEEGSEELIQSLYDHQWTRNRLTEIYVIERNFDGRKRPFMTFEHGVGGKSKEEIHSPHREAEEYKTQMDHIQEFLADTSLKALISDEIILCANNHDGTQANGIVYSIPVYNKGELTGIVAAMIPTYRINDQLERGHWANMAILINENADLFGCVDLPRETKTWISKNFSENDISEFFDTTQNSFKVNEWTSLWSPIDIVSGQQWWLVFQYDETLYLKDANIQKTSKFWIYILAAGFLLAHLIYLLFKRYDEKINILDERKIIENALVESEEQYRKLVEQTTNLITRVDNEGKFTYINSVSQKILGFSPEECIGKVAFDFVHPDDRNKTQKWFEDWQKTKQKYNSIENRQVNLHTGEIRYMLWSSTMQNDEDGGISGIDAIARDISDRIKAEQQLIESEKKVNTWLENSPTCTKILDLDFNLQYMSAAGVRDLKIDDITVYYGAPYPFSFYPDSFKIPMTKNLMKVKETGEITTQEEYVLDILGNELWYHSTIVPINTESGILDYFMIVSIEITERKYAESKLLESEARFRHLFEDMGDAVFVTHLDKNKSGQIIEANPAALLQTGYDKTELVKMNIVDDLTVKGSEETEYDEFEEKLHRGQTVTSTEKKKRKDGSEYWVEVVVTPIEYKGIKACISLNRDISDRKLAEEALKSIAVSFSALSGEDFFNRVSKYLADKLDVNIAFIGELFGGDSVRVIGGYHNGEILGPIEYQLADTPCENIINKTMCCYPADVYKLFPKDVMLKDLAIEGYLGAPINNRDGQTIGIFVLLSESPITNQSSAESILQIFIERVSAEIQRANDEQIIKKSELKFRDLFENSIDSICILDAECNFIDVNDATSILTGYDKTELLNMGISDLVHPDSQNNSIKALHDQKTFGHYDLYTGSIITKNGQTRFVEINSIAKHDEDGKFIGSRDFIRDVTKRQKLDKLKTVLMKIATEAKSDLELPDLIKSIREIVHSIIDMTHFHIGLYDELNDTIIEPYSENNQENIISYSGGDTLAGYVIENRESIFADKNYCLELKKKKKIKSFEKDCQQWLGVPLIAKDVVIGILVVKSYDDAKAYSLNDLNILNHISIEIGAVIDRKQTEDDLKNSQEQFELLMQQTPYVVEIYDIDGLQINVNNAYEELWGFPAEQTINKFNVLKSKEVKDTGLIDYVNRGYSGEAVTVPEYEFNPKGKTEADGLGRTRWLSTHIFPLKTTSGIIRNIVITHEDITDRRQAEISLIKSKNLLSESQNVARIGSYVLDIKNDQWDSSDVLDEIFDIDKNYNKNISGWLKLVYTNDRDMMINYFNTNILQNNEPFNKEYRIQRIKNQNILWVHGLGKLELDEDGDPIKMIGTIQDISIRKEFEIEKEALENHLQKSQKLETIGTLAGGITHEINQPLNAISISANSVLYWHRNNPGVLPKLFIEELQQISKGAKRIDEIIRHMRSLWVADITTKMEYNSPNQIIIDSLSLIKQQLHAHGIIIEQKFTSQDISLFSDRVSLEQIIINLLINAMHSLDESDQTDKKIIIQTRADKTSCILSISDNGGGLPEGDEMVVFSPFYSTKDPSKSMGLGLAIVKNLVNKMDGSISAVNNKPSGARFIITLPIKDEIE